jgi:OOP family OmpA-OmpF porin
MEQKMAQPTWTMRQAAALGVIALLAACAPASPPAEMAVSSNPPAAVDPAAEWYHITFVTDSFAIDSQGQAVVARVLAALRQNPTAFATIVGRTDSVGSKEYNMHLSHQRADAVRDALVYGASISAERVETRWTGESRLSIATADEVAAQANRVVDIAIH